MTRPVNQTEIRQILGPRSQLSLVTRSLSLSPVTLCNTQLSSLGMIVRLSSYLGPRHHNPPILYSPRVSQSVSTYWVFKAWQKTQIKMSILLPWGGIFSRAMAIKCNCWFILPRRLGNFYCYWQELCSAHSNYISFQYQLRGEWTDSRVESDRKCPSYQETPWQHLPQ